MGRSCSCASASTTGSCSDLGSQGARDIVELASDASGRTLLARVLQITFYLSFSTCLARFPTGSPVVMPVSLDVLLDFHAVSSPFTAGFLVPSEEITSGELEFADLTE